MVRLSSFDQKIEFEFVSFNFNSYSLIDLDLNVSLLIEDLLIEFLTEINLIESS